MPKAAEAFLKSLPTPSRAGAATARSHGEEWQPWGADCVAWLSAEGDEGRFRGRARFLDRLSVTSVHDALEGLNRRIIWCPEDLCIVFSAAERAYFLVYRRGRLDMALGQLGVTREELARISAAAASSSGAHTGVSSAGPEGRPSICEASEQLSVVSRPSLCEVAAVHSKVVRQASMPSRASYSAVPRESASHASSIAEGQEFVPDAHAVPWANSFGSVTGPTSTPASTPGVPPPVTASLQPPAAVAVAAKPGAPAPMSAQYPRLGGIGPARGAGAAAAAYQSFQPVASTPSAASGALAPAMVSARPHGRAAGGGGHRLSGEPRNSAPPPQPLSSPTIGPCRRGSTGAVPSVVPSAQDDNGPTMLPHAEALERELSTSEKVSYADLNFVENLGSGEFGQVFRGFYRGEEVAIKKLYWDDAFTDGVLQDLAKEIESFRHLRHKRLVRFIGACLEMPNPCLVTQYMPGGSLHHLLHTRKLKLPPLHATNMCLQLADGVMYLHSQNPTVVHRDLKSLNVVLDLNLNVKICDFGLTESMERTHITKRNNGGSPRYMAPELFDCKSKITEKIDIWALGCIFVEIFGGPLPYETINTLADLTREMMVHRRIPDVPEHIFGEIRAVIHRCLDFDHVLRLTSKQTFEQLKAAKKQLRTAERI